MKWLKYVGARGFLPVTCGGCLLLYLPETKARRGDGECGRLYEGAEGRYSRGTHGLRTLRHDSMMMMFIFLCWCAGGVNFITIQFYYYQQRYTHKKREFAGNSQISTERVTNEMASSSVKTYSWRPKALKRVLTSSRGCHACGGCWGSKGDSCQENDDRMRTGRGAGGS